MMMKIPKNYSLGWFPQLNPDPRMRISTDGQILYVSPASIFLLKDLSLDPERPEQLLPADYQQRLDAMLLLGEDTNTWEYCLGLRRMQCLVHYLPEHMYFHVYLTNITEQYEWPLLAELSPSQVTEFAPNK